MVGRKRSKPLCLQCGNKGARSNSHFCSYRCGSEYADALITQLPITFCYECDKWSHISSTDPSFLECGHKTNQ